MHVIELLEDDPYGESLPKNRKTIRKGRKERVKQPIIEQEHLELRSVVPKSARQRQAFDAYAAGDNLLLHGVAGTGKTYLATYFGLRTILDGRTDMRKLIFVRSAVQGREMGFTPGGPGEKMGPYEDPYARIVSELFGRDDAYQLLKRRRVIEFVSTSFLRGTTFDDAIVVPDEIQNMDGGELNTVITRLGKNTKLIMCGDHRQDDLTGKKGQVSGIRDVVRVLSDIGGMSKIEFGIDDVQRSTFVKRYLAKRIELGLDVPLDV